nr:HEAT repeat domain-containing protein [Candidatus Sigynarchaeota archaeon]
MPDPIIKLLRDNKKDFVILRAEKDPSVVNELINALKENIRTVRFNALFCLGELGKRGHVAIQEIVKFLEDKDWSLNREAIKAIGKIGFPDETSSEKILAIL